MTAALDAITRLDYGISQPGDAEIAAIFEAHCQWEQGRREHAAAVADRAEWLAGQCGGCEPGGTGEPCDLHEVLVCGHCNRPQQGYAKAHGVPLCHPNDGMDCYTRVTVLGHDTPCTDCNGREGGPR